MKRQLITPTAVKVVLPIGAIDGRKQLSNQTKLLDLGWAIRKGLVRVETDGVLGTVAAANGAARLPRVTAINAVRVYHLKKMPKPGSVQPQVYTILETLKRLGGNASRERLITALAKRLRTEQDVGTVLSLKRKPMVDGGYLQIRERAG